MKLRVNTKEIIQLDDFELSWRWEKTHNEIISNEEISLLSPLSEIESKRLCAAIEHWKYKIKNSDDFFESNWMLASSESDARIEEFGMKLEDSLKAFEENVIVNWDRRTTLLTTKEIFIKYWDDFCYPSSDDTTIISTELNWLIEYSHYEVANIWTINDL